MCRDQCHSHWLFAFTDKPGHVVRVDCLGGAPFACVQAPAESDGPNAEWLADSQASLTSASLNWVCVNHTAVVARPDAYFGRLAQVQGGEFMSFVGVSSDGTRLVFRPLADSASDLADSSGYHGIGVGSQCQIPMSLGRSRVHYIAAMHQWGAVNPRPCARCQRLQQTEEEWRRRRGEGAELEAKRCKQAHYSSRSRESFLTPDTKVRREKSKHNRVARLERLIDADRIAAVGLLSEELDEVSDLLQHVVACCSG